jgi:hypothetical protein
MGGSFFKPEDLCIGNSYKLTEFVEDKEVSSGDYFLVSVMPSKKKDIQHWDFQQARVVKRMFFSYKHMLSLVILRGDALLCRVIAGKFIVLQERVRGIIPGWK